jgi:hypothetical protein
MGDKRIDQREELKGRYHLGDLAADESILLKCSERNMVRI